MFALSFFGEKTELYFSTTHFQTLRSPIALVKGVSLPTMPHRSNLGKTLKKRRGEGTYTYTATNYQRGTVQISTWLSLLPVFTGNSCDIQWLQSLLLCANNFIQDLHSFFAIQVMGVANIAQGVGNGFKKLGVCEQSTCWWKKKKFHFFFKKDHSMFWFKLSTEMREYSTSIPFTCRQQMWLAILDCVKTATTSKGSTLLSWGVESV